MSLSSRDTEQVWPIEGCMEEETIYLNSLLWKSRYSYKIYILFGNKTIPRCFIESLPTRK